MARPKQRLCGEGEEMSSELVTKDETQEVIKPVSGPMAMIEIAVRRGASVEELNGLMALQERYEKNEASKAFNIAFAAFKAEAVQIIKNKRVDAGPLSGKKYAELYSVVNAVTPALSKHGLSASWKLTKDEKEWIEVSCTVKHVLGHSEAVSMGGPPDAGGAKSAIQARASTVSYLQRYTLKAICGVSEQGDDTDARPAKRMDEKAVADWTLKMNECTTMAEWEKVWADTAKAATAAGDVEAYESLKTNAAAKRKELKAPVAEKGGL